MVTSLYGHTKFDDRNDLTVDGSEAKYSMRERLEQRQEFSLNYFGKLLTDVILFFYCNCC